jgi:hypothetical protein
MIKSLFLLFLISILTSCNRLPEDVKLVLNASGKNRTELEKVVNHYKRSGDKEKLKATYYLIGNMDDKYSLEGDHVRKYDPVFDLFDSYTKTITLLPFNSPVVNSVWDSLVNLYGSPSVYKADVIMDYSHINADYLIENIDLAFKARNESAWSKKISFEQFCEFVLAYRIRREPPEVWRPVFYEKYRELRDSVHADSIIQLARVIHKRLLPKLRFNDIFRSYPFDIPLDKMKERRYGACPQIAVYTAMVMRSLGIPIALDYSPLWANHNAGHDWNALLLEGGKIVWFHGEDSRLGWVSFRKIAKIYRETYGRQKIELPENARDVPLSLLDDHRLDVTDEYTKAFNIRIKLKYPYESKKKYAVICTFDNKSWAVQDLGRIRKNQASFKNMGSGVVYISMYYDEGNLSPASDPFILSEEGKVTYLVPDKAKTQNMHLIRKYPCLSWVQAYSDNMLSGAFQGANYPDFRDSINLFTILKSPEKIETTSITNPSKFRYIRYRPPFTGKGEVAELEFYGGTRSSDTIKLTGKVIGFPEIPASLGTTYHKAFDGNLETFFGRFTKGDSWAGLDLGAPKRITKIKYCPRSDTNFILEGDTYELCYWENGEWISMGQQVANNQYLDYKNIPASGLYILHDLTRGKEERIFTYENGEQVWW